MSSGKFFQTMRTSSPYVFATCLRVGPTLAQYGHWKSEKSAMVTGADAFPREGAPAMVIA